jgi:hypothetical protein
MMRWCPAGAWFPQPGAPAAGQPSATRVQHGLPQAELADLIGIRGDQAAAVISELDVILIHIRAGQAAQYERLYVVPELPRWHEAPSSVPGSFVLLSAPASIRMQPRTSSPSRSQTTPGTLSTTPIPVPGAQRASLTHSSPRTRWYTAELTADTPRSLYTDMSVPVRRTADLPLTGQDRYVSVRYLWSLRGLARWL